MARILIFGFVIFFSFKSLGQSDFIKIGKRKNIIWSKKINRKNLGSIYTYYYPIYFKTPSSPYRKTGIFGRKIKDHLNLENDVVMREFSKYKVQKKLSYVLLGSTIASFSLWTYKALLYIDESGDYRPQGFFTKESLGYLGLYFVSFSSSIYFNLHGDKHLKKAVKYHNISLKEKF